MANSQSLDRPWFLYAVPLLVFFLIAFHVFALVYWIYRLSTDTSPLHLFIKLVSCPIKNCKWHHHHLRQRANDLAAACASKERMTQQVEEEGVEEIGEDVEDNEVEADGDYDEEDDFEDDS
ncbi:hypothetical protein P8452_06234 [Trifolium repens]|nr:hypothetical protein P8452_06234 [Trifolium repens]